VLTSYALVLEALREPRLSNATVPVYCRHVGLGESAVDFRRSLASWVLFRDGADHRRLRGVVAGAFTPRRIAAMRQQVAAAVEQLLEEPSRTGRIDLVGDLAARLPVYVISDLLGAPPDDRARLKVLSDDLAAFFGQVEGAPEVNARAVESYAELEAYFRRLVSARRARPSDDLLTAIVGAGERLTDDEVIASCVALLFAGHETTTHLIGNSFLALMRHPDALERLRREPALNESAVEELLRYDGSVQLVSRVAGDDLDLGGAQIRRGQRVLPVIAAANRDPAQFEAPDRLWLDRPDNKHLAFSLGAHFCLGAGLARLEAQVALSKVAAGYDFALESGPLEWFPNPSIRGLRALPVRLSPRTVS
jgi:cytochrome P450